MEPTIKVQIPFIEIIEPLYLVGQGAYPYDCKAKESHPDSFIYKSQMGGWIASHQLTDTGNGYYILNSEV